MGEKYLGDGGIQFVRAGMALAKTRGEPTAAEAALGGRPNAVIRAAVEPGTVTGNDTWGAPMTGEATMFYDVVRSRSALLQIEGLRRQLFEERIVFQDGRVAVSWVHQLDEIPVGHLHWAPPALMPRLRCAAMVVVSDEWLRFGHRRYEEMIRNDLADGTAAALDTAFLDPTNAGVPDLKPASITHGADSRAATASPDADLKAMITAFAGDLDRAVFIGSAKALASINSDRLPNVGARGGDIFGVPAIAARGNAGTIALIDPTQIAFATDGVELANAEHASILMSDAPGSDTFNRIGLWQRNLAAIRVHAYANWRRINDDAVQVLTGLPV